MFNIQCVEGRRRRRRRERRRRTRSKCVIIAQDDLETRVMSDNQRVEHISFSSLVCKRVFDGK